MIQHLKIGNEGSGILIVFVEPEASEFHARPGQIFELTVAVLHREGNFELAYSADTLRVFPADQSVGCIRVFCEGRELEPGYQMRAKVGTRS